MRNKCSARVEKKQQHIYFVNISVDFGFWILEFGIWNLIRNTIYS